MTPLALAVRASRDIRVTAAFWLLALLLLAEVRPVVGVTTVGLVALQCLIGDGVLRSATRRQCSPLGRLALAFTVGLVATTVGDQIFVRLGWPNGTILTMVVAGLLLQRRRAQRAADVHSVGSWSTAASAALVPGLAVGLLTDWWWPIPLVGGAAASVLFHRALPSSARSVRGAVATAILAVAVWGAIAWRPRTWPFQQEEQIWGALVAGSTARVGVGDSIAYAGHSIHYHWFGYAWSGLVARITGVDIFLAVAVITPVVLAIAAVLMAGEIIGRITGSSERLVVPVLLLVVASSAPLVSRGFTYFVADPSKGPATLGLLAILVLVGANTPRPSRRTLSLLGLLVFASVGSNTIIGLVAATLAIVSVWELPTSKRAILGGLVGSTPILAVALVGLWFFVGFPGVEAPGNAGIFGRGVADYLRSAVPEAEIFTGVNRAVVVTLSLSGLFLPAVLGVGALAVRRDGPRRDAVLAGAVVCVGVVGVAFGHTDRFAEQLVFGIAATAVALPVAVAVTTSRVASASWGSRIALVGGGVATVAYGAMVHLSRTSGSNGAVKLRALYPGVSLVVVVAVAAAAMITRPQPSLRSVVARTASIVLVVSLAYGAVDIMRGAISGFSVADSRERDWLLSDEEQNVARLLRASTRGRLRVETNAPQSERVVLIAAASGVRFRALIPPAVQLPALTTPDFKAAIGHQQVLGREPVATLCDGVERVVLWIVDADSLDVPAECAREQYRSPRFVVLRTILRGVGAGVD